MGNTKRYISFITIFFCAIIGTSIVAQSSNVWKNATLSTSTKKSEPRIPVEKFRFLELDHAQLKTSLQKINTNRYSSIELPMPDGSFQQFEIKASPIVEERLLAKYPFLQTYSGTAVDNPSIHIRLDFTKKGFHAFIKGEKEMIFIDPYQNEDEQHYMSYYAKYVANNEHFTCHAQHDLIDSHHHDLGSNDRFSMTTIGDQLRTFRIAIAATGEYTTFHGGTITGALSAIVTSLNRINLLFETEIATRLILIGDNDEIIYTNAATDPYNNNSLNDIILQNQTNIDNVIGSANYEIGHVFGTKGGGLAGVGAVCTNSKSWGVTGLSSPEGDVFDIVYAAHEIGHQLNAPHTFNNCNGNGGGATAYEPGSGTTIMAYAGLCGAQNVQFDTDYFFHSGSYSRIINAGNSCANFEPTGNTPPSVSSLNPTGINIPISTPFELEGSGSDADGDALVYTWDQMDIGPVSPLGSPSGNAPLFKFIPPTDSPKRVFPNIEDLLDNTSSSSEVLPTYSRSMNFRLTARDNRAGGGGVSFDDYNLGVTAAAGPFEVLSPNTNITWTVGQTETIIWDVANTNQSPVNCSQVDILLSIDGGYTYPITLAEAVPNLGSATITVPNVTGASNRIKIKGVGNIFFDLSNTNFTIETPSEPDFTITSIVEEQIICGTETANYSLSFNALSGFNETISLHASGLPTGADAIFNQNAFVPPASIALNLSDFDNSNSGVYNITITASSASVIKQIPITLDLTTSIPSSTVSGRIPVDGATNIDANETISWNAIPFCDSYDLEIATAPTFGNSIIHSTNLSTTSYTLPNLDSYTIYFWRIKGNNICGTGDFSSVFAFQTEQAACKTYAANDTPIAISNGSPNSITSIINVPDNFTITDLNITNVNGKHTYISDLSMFLTAPDGGIRQFHAQMCGGNANFDLGYDDESIFSTIPCPPTTGQVYQAASDLSYFEGRNSNGDWILTIYDNFTQDGGSLDDWTLELCQATTSNAVPSLVSNFPISLSQGQTVTINNSDLSAFLGGTNNDDIHFMLRSLPTHGSIRLSGAALQLGESFSQSDIDNGRVKYLQDGTFTANDHFDFDILTTAGAWASSFSFNFNIFTSSLSLNANITTPLTCFEGTNAAISGLASGGSSPYEYSIDGINFQFSPNFNNLSAGIYTMHVKDANGIQNYSSPITITEPDEMIISTYIEENVLTIIASGGTGAYICSIDGINYSSNDVFTDLENGDYTVYVKDANDCLKTSDITVAVNPLNVFSAVEQNIDCADMDNGRVRAFVSGGSPPYSYSIDGENYQTSDVFENLGAGTYEITVQEFEGFTKTSTPITLLSPDAINTSVTINENEVLVNASGGTGNLMYSIDGINFQSNPLFSDLSNGEYTFYIQDENSCISTTTATVSANDLVVVAIINQEITCVGSADAVVTVSVNGGTPPYQYSIDEGESFQTSMVFSDLAPNNYTFMVKDANDWTFTTNAVLINDATPLDLTTAVSGSTINIDCTGGTGTYEYSLDTENWQSSSSFTNLSPDTYTVYVRDENFCMATSSVSVGTTSINTLFESEEIQLFPNPTTSNFTIQLPKQQADLMVKLYDMQGKMVYTNNFPKNNLELNLSLPQLANGVYQLVLTNGQQFNVKKLMVAK